MPPKIDLRSDTFTVPTPAMKAAMCEAELGDDVFDEDPTVTKLEQHLAALAGKENGLYCPSGTMCNLIAMMLHGEGLFSEIIAGDNSHVCLYEVGNGSLVGRVFMRQIPNEADGTMAIDKLKRAIQVPNVHYCTTRAIFLENTHNARGGKILPLEYVKEVRQLCDENKIGLHCDGARLWNACVATSTSLKDMAAPFDTLSLCLSKALGAPIGSVLVGTNEVIAKARRCRKMLGGGMRQVGIIAAAGLYAVENQFERLAEDHQMARFLCDEITKLGFKCVVPDTNIVIWDILSNPAVYSGTRDEFVDKCGAEGLLLVTMGAEGNVRAIPHLGNTMEDMQEAINTIRRVIQ